VVALALLVKAVEHKTPPQPLIPGKHHGCRGCGTAATGA
jgi:hypothetical protein